MIASNAADAARYSRKKKVHGLWRELVRAPDARLSGHADRTSLLPLPHAAVVPGARFSETYYWDS